MPKRGSDDEKQETERRRQDVLNAVSETMEPYRVAAEAAEREAASRPRRRGIPVSTANDVPGFEITDYVGEVFGNVVRSRGAIPQTGAQLKSVVGGELKTMTELLNDARRIAIDRMVEEAGRIKADAVVAMRVTVTTLGGANVVTGLAGASDWTEVCAYGTGVRARRITTSNE